MQCTATARMLMALGFLTLAPQLTLADTPVQPASVSSSSDRPLWAMQHRGWEVFGRSVEGNPLEFAQFGPGPRQVIVVGSLEGDRPEGSQLAETLADHLLRFPRRLNGVTVTIVRDPNPDGRKSGQRGNGNGVHLDRNFFSSDWRKLAEGAHWISGQQPESEPETRALLELISDIRPERLILLSADERPWLEAAGPAEHLAQQLAGGSGLPLHAMNAAPLSGSLTRLAGTDRGIPTVKIYLPRHKTAEANWATHKAAVMLAIEGRLSPAATTNPDGAGPVPSQGVGPIQSDEVGPLQPSGQRDWPTDGPRVLNFQQFDNQQTVPISRPTAAAPRAVVSTAQAPSEATPLMMPPPTVELTAERDRTLDGSWAAAGSAARGPAQIDGQARHYPAVERGGEMRRLPPVEPSQPSHAPPSDLPANMPQAPIPIYPRTGF